MNIASKFLYSFLLVSISCFGNALATQKETDVPEVINKLNGIWNEVILSESSCSDRRYFHSFALSNNGLVLIKKYVAPIVTPIATTTEESYRILYGDSNSVVLYREGEVFENADTGDKVIRQLILESDNNTYAWRIIGKPKNFRAAGGGMRCN